MGLRSRRSKKGRQRDEERWKELLDGRIKGTISHSVPKKSKE